MGATREVEYRIKTIADVRALQDTKKGLEANIKVTKELGQSTAVLEKELQRANRALESQRGKAAASALELNKTIAAMRKGGLNPGALVAERNSILAGVGMSGPSRLGEAISAFGVGGVRGAISTFGPAAAGAAAAVAGTGKALHEYANAQERVAKLEAALSSRGLNSGGFLENLQEQASALERLTGRADDEWIDVLSRLVQFGANQSNIGAATDAVKNLAGVLGGDLNAAALMVGKALQGEFTAFSRLGIEFDKNASQAENLKHLYESLAKMGAGVLENQAKTLNGQIRQLTNGVSNLGEAFGKKLAAPAGQALYGLATSLNWIANLIGGPIQGLGGLKNAVVTSATAMEESQGKIKSYGDEFEKLKTKAHGAATEINAAVAALRSVQDAQDSQESANADLETAKIDAAVAAGVMNPKDAAVAKAGVRARLEEARNQRASDLRRAEMGMTDQAIVANVAGAQGMDAKAKDEESKLGRFQSFQKEAEKIADKYDSLIRQQESIVEEVSAKVAGQGLLFGASGEDLKRKDDAKAELERLQNARARDIARFRRTHEFFDVGSQENVARTARESATKAAEAAAEANAPLFRRAGELATLEQTAPGVNATMARTRRLETFSQVVPMAQGENGANGIASPLNDIVASTSAQTGTTRDLIGIVRQHAQRTHQGVVDLRGEVARLRTELDTLSSQYRNGRSR